MKHDVFHHHDGVVDHQPDGRGQSAQRHQVETLAEQLERDEGHSNGDRNHQSRHQRCAPVAKENHQNDRSQNQAEQNRVAHALDGVAHDDRLIVERLESAMPGGSDLAYLLDLSVDFIRDLHRVAVGLTVDVEQHRRFPVGGHDGVDRLHARRHRRDVSDTHRNAGRRVLDDDVRDLLAGSRTWPLTSASTS